MLLHRAFLTTLLSTTFAAAGPVRVAPKPAAAPKPAGEQRFPFATGRLTYSIDGPVTRGKRVVTWMDYGRKFRQELSGKAGQAPHQIKMDGWVIGDGSYIYTSQQGPAKRAIRSRARVNGHEMDPTGMPLIAGATDMGKADGKGTVLGRPCEIRKMGPARFWVWRSLPLKMEMDMGTRGKVVMQATQLDTSFKPSSALFRVPAGYKVEDSQPVRPQRRVPPTRLN